MITIGPAICRRGDKSTDPVLCHIPPHEKDHAPSDRKIRNTAATAQWA
jgi:hypothetical protein